MEHLDILMILMGKMRWSLGHSYFNRSKRFFWLQNGWIALKSQQRWVEPGNYWQASGEGECNSGFWDVLSRAGEKYDINSSRFLYAGYARFATNTGLILDDGWWWLVLKGDHTMKWRVLFFDHILCATWSRLDGWAPLILWYRPRVLAIEALRIPCVFV